MTGSMPGKKTVESMVCDEVVGLKLLEAASKSLGAVGGRGEREET